jgi:hypothetical protein
LYQLTVVFIASPSGSLTVEEQIRFSTVVFVPDELARTGAGLLGGLFDGGT